MNTCTTDILAISDTLEILGGRWKLIILHYLMSHEGESNTFNKMEKNIPGISAKMLSKDLKTLELNKLITRTVKNTQPVTVKYAITDYAKSVQEVIQTLVAWGTQHRHHIFNA